VAVSGPAGIIADTVRVFGSANVTLLVGALVLVLLILLLVYRAPLLAVIPLATAGIAIQVTDALGAMLVKAGVITVNSQTASIMSVLVIGLGTDYCLFIISGYRDRLGDDPRPDLQTRLAAMRAAMAAVAESLAYSAITVVLVLATLLLATLPALHSFGPFLALSVVVTLLACATFAPAVVVLAGRAALWPRRAARTAGPAPRGWAMAARVVLHRPGAVIAGCLALLAVLSLGLLGYRQSYDLIAGFRITTESKAGQQLLAAAFPAGQLAPTEVVVDDPATVPALRDKIEALSGVREVSAQTAPDGRHVRLTVVYTDNPYRTAALDRTRHIRDLAHATGAPALTGGQSATSLDLRTANDRDLRLLVPAVLLAIALVLMTMTRSLLAPLYLVATILASLAATLGVTTLFLITLPGSDGYGSRVVAYIFVFLTALGIDYNIYLVTQLRREVAAHGLTAGLTLALTRTGRVITSAGAVLAASFAILLSQPIDLLFQFGFAMAVGILLDTLLVRGLLVPAIIAKLGARAWWPAQLRGNAGSRAE
jgi:RND superfamily putative drug exporter